VWFFVIGGLLFALGRRVERNDHVLHVRRESLTSLMQAEARRRHLRELPTEDAAALRERAIDDELLYRDGLRLGVDKNDTIVRQRVIEKMRFLAEDVAGGARPITDAELAQYMGTHAAKYARPAQVSFVHVFSATAPGELARVLPTLPPGIEGDASTPPAVGDPFPLGRRVVDAPLAAVEQSYGPGFRDALTRLPVGAWSEPLESRYGYHLVKVIARRAGGPPAFAEVRSQVRVDFVQEAKARAAEELLRSIRDRYTVTIDDREDGVALSSGADNSREAD
jgi:hypothetical protein